MTRMNVSRREQLDMAHLNMLPAYSAVLFVAQDDDMGSTVVRFGLHTR